MTVSKIMTTMNMCTYLSDSSILKFRGAKTFFYVVLGQEGLRQQCGIIEPYSFDMTVHENLIDLDWHDIKARPFHKYQIF